MENKYWAWMLIVVLSLHWWIKVSFCSKFTSLWLRLLFLPWFSPCNFLYLKYCPLTISFWLFYSFTHQGFGLMSAIYGREHGIISDLVLPWGWSAESSFESLLQWMVCLDNLKNSFDISKNIWCFVQGQMSIAPWVMPQYEKLWGNKEEEGLLLWLVCDKSVITKHKHWHKLPLKNLLIFLRFSSWTV